MRTVKWIPFLLGACISLGGTLLWVGAARADVSSTNPAAIVIFPKLIVDTTSAGRTDTIIQLTNTADHPVDVRCFYVDANGHCSDAPDTICDSGGDPAASSCAPTARCLPGWQEIDFAFRLTTKQPIVWTVGGGLTGLPLAAEPGPNGEVNEGSIPVAPEDPMRGELKCVEVRPDGLPADPTDENGSNHLKGEATIETLSGAGLDIRSYNAIGIQAIAGTNNHDNRLAIGEEYNGCPNILVLDHFFDNATEPSAAQGLVRTDLTLVPCTEDFNLQAPLPTVVQFLVFNEFEQRLSTSRTVTCFAERAISDLDTRLGPGDDQFSIFNIGVEGTLTGQTLIRGVADTDTEHGHGLLGVAEEFHQTAGANLYSDAFSLVQRGTRGQLGVARTQLDYISMPPPQPFGD